MIYYFSFSISQVKRKHCVFFVGQFIPKTESVFLPPKLGAGQNPPVGGPSQEMFSGPGLTIIGRDNASTKTVGMSPASSASAPSNTQKQAAPAFQSGNLVRLRSGGPLMTVKDIKGDQVDCFWTNVDGQINADSFPVDVLQRG